jgi:hypothetical protein
VCPLCRQFFRQRLLRDLGRVVCVAVIALLALALQRASPSSGRSLAGAILIFPVLSLATTVFHEGAHAVAGWMTGARIFEIRIGSGRLLRSIRVGRLRLTLGRSFTRSGHCVGAYPPERYSRWKEAFFVGAPTLGEFLLAAAIAPRTFLLGGALGVTIWDPVLVLLSWSVLQSAMPRRAIVAGRDHSTDGGLILRLFSKPEEVEKRGNRWSFHLYRVRYGILDDDERETESALEDLEHTGADGTAEFVWRAYGFLLGKRYRAAAEAAIEAERGSPASERSREEQEALLLGQPPMAQYPGFLLAAARAEGGRRTAAFAFCEERIEAARDDPALLALWECQFAYLLLEEDPDPADTERAEQLVESAMEKLPWVGSVLGTRGIAHVLRGEYEEGLVFLERAGHYGWADSHDVRLAWQALAHAGLDRLDRAKKCLRAARRYCFDRDRIDRIEARVKEIVSREDSDDSQTRYNPAGGTSCAP